MNIFLLATIACVVIYYGSRIGLTLYVSAKGIDLTQKGTKIEGFLPNLLAVGWCSSWVSWYGCKRNSISCVNS